MWSRLLERTRGMKDAPRVRCPPRARAARCGGGTPRARAARWWRHAWHGLGPPSVVAVANARAVALADDVASGGEPPAVERSPPSESRSDWPPKSSTAVPSDVTPARYLHSPRSAGGSSSSSSSPSPSFASPSGASPPKMGGSTIAPSERWGWCGRRAWAGGRPRRAGNPIKGLLKNRILASFLCSF